MKNLITIINLSIIIAITTIFTRSDKPVREVTSRVTHNEIASGSKHDIDNSEAIHNTIKSNFTWPDLEENKSVEDEGISAFLKEMAEARMMDLQEGKAAEQQATNKSLKQYGSLMVADQSKMLEELRKLAEQKKIFISSSLGSDKAEALADLRKVHGESFDRKFTKMMILHHRRDLKKLEKATEYGDADIQVFATKYLPVVQSHLDRIKALKKGD